MEASCRQAAKGMSMTHQFRIWGPVCLAVMLLVGATSAKALPSTVAAQRASLSEAALPRLVVSPNGRFIQGDDGSPFFWMGDTVWSMLHHSTRAEAEQYLLDRQARGFNVIVASVISEAPLTTVTGQGCLSLSNNDPLSPNECYFAHIDWVVARAAELGIYVALVPTWGDKVSLEWGPGPVIFTPENARPYGRMLATRYQSATNVVWVLGGDRLVRDQTQATIWNEIATGLTEGLVAVGADPLIYYHPPQFWRASDTFHENPLFDLNAWQSGHSGQDVPVWEQITQDYNRVPAKPVFDSEPPYEDHPVNWGNSPGFFRDYEVRRQVYRSVFAGGFGVNYGNHAVWQWYAPGRTGIWGPERFWYESLGRPGATQMLHLRRLMESRPFFTRIPDQRLLVSPQGSGINHVQATRDSDGSYAMVYIPSPQTVTVDMSQLTGGPVAA